MPTTVPRACRLDHQHPAAGQRVVLDEGVAAVGVVLEFLVAPAVATGLEPPAVGIDRLELALHGIDIKYNWRSPEFDWGRLSASIQSTHVLDYRAQAQSFEDMSAFYDTRFNLTGAGDPVEIPAQVVTKDNFDDPKIQELLNQ